MLMKTPASGGVRLLTTASTFVALKVSSAYVGVKRQMRSDS